MEIIVAMDRKIHTSSMKYGLTNQNGEAWAVGFAMLANGTLHMIDIPPGGSADLDPPRKWLGENMFYGAVTYKDEYGFKFAGKASEEFHAIMTFAKVRKEIEKRLAKLNGTAVSA
jgi:hypothetical protein